MSDYKSAAFVEGGRVPGAASAAEWHYRINRAVRLDGAQVFEVLLTCDDPHRKGGKLYSLLAEFATLEQAREASGMLYFWLAEFATLEQAREAAHRVLTDMTIFMHSLEALDVARKGPPHAR